jgi:hypothetical protein
MVAIDDLSSHQFYHGTKSDLKPGTLSSPATPLTTVRGRIIFDFKSGKVSFPFKNGFTG